MTPRRSARRHLRHAGTATRRARSIWRSMARTSMRRRLALVLAVAPVRSIAGRARSARHAAPGEAEVVRERAGSEPRFQVAGRDGPRHAPLPLARVLWGHGAPLRHGAARPHRAALRPADVRVAAPVRRTDHGRARGRRRRLARDGRAWILQVAAPGGERPAGGGGVLDRTATAGGGVSRTWISTLAWTRDAPDAARGAVRTHAAALDCVAAGWPSRKAR